MKIISTILLLFLITSFSAYNSHNEIIDKSDFSEAALVVVTFKCESCTRKNKFSVAGPDEFTEKNVKFPLVKKLQPGKYEMTYWQNRVQQIRLPFTVIPNSENTIIVKD